MVINVYYALISGHISHLILQESYVANILFLLKNGSNTWGKEFTQDLKISDVAGTQLLFTSF